MYRLAMPMATHRMGFAREVPDRVCFFCQGRIAEEGNARPESSASRPTSEPRQFPSAVLDAR